MPGPAPGTLATSAAAATLAHMRVLLWRWRLPLAATALSAFVLGFVLTVADSYIAADERLGIVDFPISCGWRVQPDFTRATALLHLFQFADAETGYRGIIEQDPDCAIAYWGVAMSRLRNPLYAWPSSSDVAIARRALAEAATARVASARERAYVAALAKLFDTDSGRDWQDRERDYADAMGGVAAAYPWDGEAKIFYALALNVIAAKGDGTSADRTKAAEILLRVFGEQPHHPGIEHYLTYCLGHIGYQPKPFEKEGVAMAPRQRLMLAALALIALCGVGVFLIVTSDFRTGTSGTNDIGGPFALTASDGRLVTDRDFRGKWMLVYFGYTNCPDMCPTTLADVAQVLGILGPLSAKLQPVFVSIDPERDTPAAMGKFTAEFDPRIIGLTGRPEDIAAIAKEYRVFYKKMPGPAPDIYAMEHSSYIYVMGPDGRYVTLLPGFPNLVPGDTAARLRELLVPSSQSSQQETSDTVRTSITAYSGNQ